MMRTLLTPPEGGEHLIWIDDRFFADEAAFKRRVREPENMPIMDDEWVVMVLDEKLPLPVGPNRHFVRYGRDFLAVCRELDIGFSVSCFGHFIDRPTLTRDARTCFLLDVQNEIELDPDAPEYTQNPDKYNNDRDTYGILFAVHNRLVPTRFRFFSRLRGPDQTDDASRLLDVDSEELDRRYITVDNGAKHKLKRWLVDFRNHTNPVAETIRFYARPWLEDGWPGKWHASLPDGNHSHPYYGQELAKWIGQKVEDVGQDALTEASKCLFVWRSGYWGDWFFGHTGKGDAIDLSEKPQPSGYVINGQILNDFLKRLKIGVTGIIKDLDYRMPVNPALPFLLAVRTFAAATNDDKPEIHWHRDIDGIATHRISIRGSDCTWGPRDAYHDIVNREGRIKYHTTLLKNVLHACVEGSDSVLLTPHPSSSEAEWETLRSLFRGVKVNGKSVCVCAVSFTPGWVHLFWTTKS